MPRTYGMVSASSVERPSSGSSGIRMHPLHSEDRGEIGMDPTVQASLIFLLGTMATAGFGLLAVLLRRSNGSNKVLVELVEALREREGFTSNILSQMRTYGDELKAVNFSLRELVLRIDRLFERKGDLR